MSGTNSSRCRGPNVCPRRPRCPLPIKAEQIDHPNWLNLKVAMRPRDRRLPTAHYEVYEETLPFKTVAFPVGRRYPLAVDEGTGCMAVHVAFHRGQRHVWTSGPLWTAVLAAEFLDEEAR